MDSSLFINRVIDSCRSTNDLARVLGDQGHPHGSWVSAKVQEAGRGRLGREWVSLEENLFLSLLIRHEPRAQWGWLPLVAAVGVVGALRELKFERVSIKWPNDVVVSQKSQTGELELFKLGGILCEAVGMTANSYAIVGLGLNCAHTPPVTDQKVTSLSDLSGRGITADFVREKIIQGILDQVARLSRKGVEAIRESFMSLSVLQPKTEIVWTDSSSGALMSAEVLGLGKNGELSVKLATGEKKELLAEEVSLHRK
ncbi:biotin--[acetyl-CoA-carboxylase] ligase [Bdellovibrionota bacterium FG-2]